MVERIAPRRLPLDPGEDSLAGRLARRSVVGTLFRRRPDDRLECTACAHRCLLADGDAGACGVRFARGSVLRVPSGYVAQRHVRSIETNTVYHVLPGARALTFGMFGCDLKCPYCHNHRLSQALRDGGDGDTLVDIGAADLVREALDHGCEALCAAYNEPMITAEWARAIFEIAKASGLVTVLVSDGNSTPEALEYMRPVTDVFRVDLKSYDERSYRRLAGRLAPVLDSIARARALGYWVEVVTLVVPGLSDEATGLSRLGRRLAAIDRDMPWHLNGFVPRYRMRDVPRTAPLALMSALGSAYANGLRYVYAGNALEVGELAHTRCADCREIVVRRHDYTTLASTLEGDRCPSCHAPVPGIWSRGAVA